MLDVLHSDCVIFLLFFAKLSEVFLVEKSVAVQRQNLLNFQYQWISVKPDIFNKIFVHLTNDILMSSDVFANGAISVLTRLKE